MRDVTASDAALFGPEAVVHPPGPVTHRRPSRLCNQRTTRPNALASPNSHPAKRLFGHNADQTAGRNADPDANWEAPIGQRDHVARITRHSISRICSHGARPLLP